MMVESGPVPTGGGGAPAASGRGEGDGGSSSGSSAAAAAASALQHNQGKKSGGSAVTYTYPMVKESDMSEEMRGEVMDICGTACEKHATNNESAAKLIKETMDKKYGNSWHVVVGEGFGFEVSYEVSTLMYMFMAGNLAVCVWKCS